MLFVCRFLDVVLLSFDFDSGSQNRRILYQLRSINVGDRSHSFLYAPYVPLCEHPSLLLRSVAQD